VIVGSGILEEMCREILDGFGDAKLGEWTDDRPQAFHLRRRLTSEEEKRVGPVLDCRGTNEGVSRLEKIAPLLPTFAMRFAEQEISK
jgi:hypothetical protein